MVPWSLLLKSLPWSDIARAAPDVVRKFRNTGGDTPPPPPRPDDAGEAVTYAEHEHLRREFEDFRGAAEARVTALETALQLALLQSRRRDRWLLVLSLVGLILGAAALALILLR